MGARLRFPTAHGLTQPVQLQRGVRHGGSESPLLYGLLLDPLLRAQGPCLRPPGEAERGLIQAHIDNLLVVADTLQNFVETLEAVDAYIGGMGMELNPRKCAMGTTEGLLDLHLPLCPWLAIPRHRVLAVDSVPYLGLQLLLDGVFSVQHRHRLHLPAVHHWCPNTLAHCRFVVRGLRFEASGTRPLSVPGATWLGWVISLRPEPSGGPFMTHLLPGGVVPRFHGAWSLVPPRPPHFATPRSVRYLATLVAGAYPLRRPPNA